MNERSPRIIEMVGLAGAGKTTLAKALCQISNRIYICEHPNFHKIEHIPFFAWNSLLMLPTFTRLYFTNFNEKWLTPVDLARMVIMNGWWRLLQRKKSNTNNINIVDNGPLMILAGLRIFGPDYIKNESMKKWWDFIIMQLANVIDAIIWLDATDTILLDRVHKRDKWHPIKEHTERDAIDFYTRYRSEYGELISIITTSAEPPRVIAFDTGELSVPDLIKKTLIALNI